MNISLICACKNRLKPLTISLSSWLFFDEIKEIILVDWDSNESLSHLISMDPRIKVIKVCNKKYFNQPQPLNLAASISTGDYILKVDSDYIFNPYYLNFSKDFKVDEKSFQTGEPILNSYETDIRTQTLFESHYFKFLKGLLLITRKNFEKVNGYNETLTEFYGYEDEEMQKRLEILGLVHNKLDYGYSIIHIPHQDSKRIENFSGKNDELYDTFNQNISNNYYGEDVKYQLDYAITQYHIKFNHENFSNTNSYYNEKRTNWKIKEISKQIYIATELN